MKILFTILFVAAVGIAFCTALITPSAAQRRAKAFSHSTPAHKNGKYADCAFCHKLPTTNWIAPRHDKQPPYPDVANFPNPHGAANATVCISCHTRDVYTDGGVFCGTCHTVASMRAKGGAGVLPFPVKGRARQFNTIFPHSTHQDLLADNRPQVAVAHFVRASFKIADNKPKPDFYNCSICHKTDAQMPRFGARKLLELKPLSDIAADTFERPVKASFFKNSPEGHASCFTCHFQYQNLPPGKRSCAGCHESTQPYTEKKALERYSIKFDHDRTGHVEKDCASCHLRIAQNADIKTLKDADVPIAACWSCHATQENERTRRVLFAEIEAREASIANKQTPFQCTYCHTSIIGRYEIPATHRKP